MVGKEEEEEEERSESNGVVQDAGQLQLPGWHCSQRLTLANPSRAA